MPAKCKFRTLSCQSRCVVGMFGRVVLCGKESKSKNNNDDNDRHSNSNDDGDNNSNGDANPGAAISWRDASSEGPSMPDGDYAVNMFKSWPVEFQFRFRCYYVMRGVCYCNACPQETMPPRKKALRMVRMRTALVIHWRLLFIFQLLTTSTLRMWELFCDVCLRDGVLLWQRQGVRFSAIDAGMGEFLFRTAGGEC